MFLCPFKLLYEVKNISNRSQKLVKYIFFNRILTTICISRLAIFKSEGLLTNNLLRAYRFPLLALTRKTTAKPPAECKT